MKKYNIKDFDRGWFIGYFDSSIFKTDLFEIAIKKYNAGEQEPTHLHKIAKEYTLIIDGKVLMNNNEFISGDIIEIEANESTNFFCVENTTTCVIKIPSISNDKFFV